VLVQQSNVNGSSQPDAAALNRFLIAFGDRLQSPPSDLDRIEQGERFIQLVVVRNEDVDENGYGSIKALVSHWGNDEGSGERAFPNSVIL
jgi:hypothetical protein